MGAWLVEDILRCASAAVSDYEVWEHLRRCRTVVRERYSVPRWGVGSICCVM